MLWGGMLQLSIPVRAVAALGVLAAATPGLAKAPLYQWVQYTSTGLEARAIVEPESLCPALVIDNKQTGMTARSEPGPNYPIRVCFASVPLSAKIASLAGKALPLPKPHPERILLVGDTGCRISSGAVQDCNDREAWPFAKGSALEAGLKPDLVIHLGDFDYREAPCPLNNLGCVGSPFGDKWPVWRQDFFEPARPLLESTPFIFVRGNHEECDRGGKGWSRTLDPYPSVSADGCLSLGEPFAIDLGGPKLVVMDVASAPELRASPRLVDVYRKQFRNVARLAPSGPVWLALHRPIWASGVYILGLNIGDNKTLAEAGRNDIPANVDALLSGHIHTFQIMSYKEDLPIQIVSGNGGDELHTSAPSDPVGMVIDGVTVTVGSAAPGIFGFAMLDREPGGWRVTNYDMNAQPRNICHMNGRKLICDLRVEAKTK